MSETLLRAEIKTLMDSVTGIGVVHDYQRWITDWAKFLDAFKDKASKTVIGWQITRSGFDVAEFTSNKYKVTHKFKLIGIYALKDSAKSEHLFNAVVEAVVLKMLSNTITGAQGKSVPKLGALQERVFGSVLCHYAEIDLPVTEIVEEVSEETTTDLLKVHLDHYLQEPTDDGVVDGSDIVSLEGP